jgi:hypothetical protein
MNEAPMLKKEEKLPGRLEVSNKTKIWIAINMELKDQNLERTHTKKRANEKTYREIGKP